jgi:hypothetical protein
VDLYAGYIITHDLQFSVSMETSSADFRHFLPRFVCPVSIRHFGSTLFLTASKNVFNFRLKIHPWLVHGSCLLEEAGSTKESWAERQFSRLLNITSEVFFSAHAHIYSYNGLLTMPMLTDSLFHSLHLGASVPVWPDTI